MSTIARWIADRVPANTDLTPEELGRLALDVRNEEVLWRAEVKYDTIERFYRQLYRDPNVDVWLITWVEGQATGYHDHDRSAGGVVVCDGELNEDYFARDDDGWIRERTNVHGPGGTFIFDSTYIHGVRHPGGTAAPASSIHVYSPALWRMGHYEADGNGVMRRTAVTYADELLGLG